MWLCWNSFGGDWFVPGVDDDSVILLVVLLRLRGTVTLAWTLLGVRVAETPLVTREVVQVPRVLRRPTRGQTRAHVGGAVRGVAETVELTPVRHTLVL